MATHEFTPEVKEVKIDPSQIKQQYSQMNAQAEQVMNQSPLSPEEMQASVAKERERLALMLPYYREQKEALELEIAITSMECKMGRVDPRNIPGTIGRNLQIEELESKLQWAHLTMQQQNMLNDLNKKKEELKNEDTSKQTDRIDPNSTDTKTAQ